MVWAAFAGTTRTDLYIMPGDEKSKRGGVTSRMYLDILEQGLPTIMGGNLVFMRDNAPIHGARIIKLWLTDMAFNVMEWPPYSPDLNPIEYSWFPLKEKVHKLHPHLENMSGGNDKVKDALAKLDVLTGGRLLALSFFRNLKVCLGE